MRTDLVLDALEMAIWTRGRQGIRDLSGLVHHSDAGSQYTSIAFTERLAETEIGLFKTELIHHRGPWRGLDDVELATWNGVDWHNHRRLHSACHDLTPAEYELIHYGQHPALTEAGVSIT